MNCFKCNETVTDHVKCNFCSNIYHYACAGIKELIFKMTEGSTAEIQTQISQLREWLNSKPLLPKSVDDFFLRRFLHSCYYDLEKSKTALELFFTIRISFAEMLNNRDPLSLETQETMNYIQCGDFMSGNRRLWCWQINDPGLDNYEYALDIKFFLMSFDARLLDHANAPLQESDIVIMNIKDLSLKFLTKINLSIERKMAKFQGEAAPIRLKQIHLVNVPSVFDKIFTIVKPLFTKEVVNVVHLHMPNSDTIFKYLDKQDVPEDFGGTGPKVEELMKRNVELLMKYREQLMEKNLWQATSKKLKSNKTDLAEGATFRSLAID